MIRRLVPLLAAMVVLIAACGNPPRPELVDDAAADSVQPVAIQQTAPIPTATPSGTPEAEGADDEDPDQVWVALARDTVGTLVSYDEPDGQPVTFDIPVTNPTYFGTRLALMVTEGDEDDEWVKVQLPVRPNETEAWVRASDFDFETHSYRARIDLADHRVRVWDGDELITDTEAVIGKESTPTPLGRFFVNDLVPGDGAVYGSWILSLSAFSETLETFNGGLPVIAIHGTNRPDQVGQEISNGCVRVPNDVIELLADEVPLGTPVDIYA